MFFYFHPEDWGNDPILTNIFQMGWFNHQLDWTYFRFSSVDEMHPPH